MTDRFLGLVLAAGRGSRLVALDWTRPKWLLPIGSETIASTHLQALSQARVTRVVVITGYAADQLELLAQQSQPLRVECAHNEQWAVWNNWHSMRLGLRHAFSDPSVERVVVLNSDFYAPGDALAPLLQRLLEMPDQAIAVDFERPLTDEAMKVSIRHNAGQPVLADIGKVSVPDPVGEYVGAIALGRAGAEALCAVLDEFEVDASLHNDWYERAIRETADRALLTWVCVPVKGANWVEIDDDSDFERAQELL